MSGKRTKNAAQDLDDLVKELALKTSLESWNSFVEELKVPGELLPALQSNRAELVKIAPARPLSIQEVRVLYRLIGGLLETNAALRTHAQQLARLVDNWGAAFKQLQSVGNKIQCFANFKTVLDDEEEEDAA